MQVGHLGSKMFQNVELFDHWHNGKFHTMTMFYVQHCYKYHIYLPSNCVYSLLFCCYDKNILTNSNLQKKGSIAAYSSRGLSPS